ncbi:MAG: NADP transhydrogenase subunit alpha [Anaerolineales bacterium]|nr:MAG: NADP transhydrogenase subunit alpha [Anaerolineales bacterium]
MSKSLKYTVIGAGNGGKAMAAHLALMGKEVTLYNRTASRVEAIKEMGTIHLDSYEGGPHGIGELKHVTSDMAEALDQADMVMVVVPATAHASIAARAAPHLRDGQVVILHPGRTGGALEFINILRDLDCTAEVKIAEAGTFIYASRSEGPAGARIFRIKSAVGLAAIPAADTQEILKKLKDVYPEFMDGKTVLHTGLDNMGAIFHPALTLLNSGRIESTAGDFQFYIDGVTPSTARVLEVLDRERVTVASAVGVRARTALEWLREAYNVQGDNLYEAIQNQTGYYGITAPKTLNHRYIFEDVPMSLVPLASLAKRYGVSVRGIESIIRLACFVHQTDYWRRGRTLDKLGIGDHSVTELNEFLTTGARIRK